MGQTECHDKKPKVATRNHFDFKQIIGKGGFGKVWKVAYKKTNSLYALKVMSKVKIIDRKSEDSIMSERSILSTLNHPFLINMIYAFQDVHSIYLVMDLLLGGDLRFHLDKFKRFNEEQTKFFMGCIILGLEYIHENNIIHRDIKPENIVFDEKGYLRITDFGIAKKTTENIEYDTSGTPNYMAPEVLYGHSQNKEVDYYGLGVIGYECMFGTRPYKGNTRKEIKNSMLSKEINIKENQVPLGWSTDAADLMNKLLLRKSSERLGKNGISEIKNHPWFKHFNWEDLANQKLRSPFYPGRGDNFDRKFCEAEEKLGLDTQERYQEYKNNEHYKSLFNQYTYDNIPQEDSDSTPISCQSTRSSPKESIQISNMPFKIQMLHKRIHIKPKDSFSSRSYIALNSNNKLKNENQASFIKDSLPMINSAPLQKSSSSMSIYKTNQILPPLIKKQNIKDLASLSQLKQSFRSPLKKISHHNFAFKDMLNRKRYGATILLRQFEQEESQVM